MDDDDVILMPIKNLRKNIYVPNNSQKIQIFK
jgi:hypothetical protein